MVVLTESTATSLLLLALQLSARSLMRPAFPIRAFTSGPCLTRAPTWTALVILWFIGMIPAVTSVFCGWTMSTAVSSTPHGGSKRTVLGTLLLLVACLNHQ